MRKWRFRKDLMPNAGGLGKPKVEYAAIDDPLSKIYPSKRIRFGGITQITCGVFISIFGLGMYTFGVKGWRTEYFVHVCLAAGWACILNGIWGTETAKFTSQWKITVNVALCCVTIVTGFAVLIAACMAIPVEFRALDEGMIRELTHMEARIVLIIMAVISDLISMVFTGSQIRIGFRAILVCCANNDEPEGEAAAVML